VPWQLFVRDRWLLDLEVVHEFDAILTLNLLSSCAK
jgi:hypothetical protein